MASHSKCSRTGAGSGDLSIDDVLYEILLRLSAKELCCLRLVCRRWRSLLSDPHFIAAHAASHPGPLIVAGYSTSRGIEGFIADIIDTSGRVVKRIRATHNERVKSIQRDLICTIVGNMKRYRLRNLATGAVHVLPGGLSEQHAALGRDVSRYRQLLVLGHVASSGEYKFLRVFQYGHQQFCEVFTHDGSNRVPWWRWWIPKKAPPSLVNLDRWSSVVVDRIVYFLSHECGYIPSFDLETEEWKQTLRGPLSLHGYAHWCDLSVATLNCCLVVVHHVWHACRDLWFLMDMEKGLWVKKHSIQITVRNGLRVHPLFLLDDGKIVLVSTEGTLVITYDPRTKTSADMAEMRGCVSVGLFTGSLLRLAIGTS